VVRLPYWRTIPAAGDEVNQAIYALRIAQGQHLPLVGNDAYAGPFFFYLLAALFRLGIRDPLLGRTIVLLAGVATVPVTYAWMRALGAGDRVRSLAALLVACNPHLILLNSHVGGTTFLLPFLTTTSLWLLSAAVQRDRPGLLVAAGAVAGLALQSNPVAAPAVAGAWLWLVVRARRTPRLGERWPLWPLLGGACVVLVYAPVIAYNLRSGLGSVDVLNQRSYLWQAEPSPVTFLPNLWRLLLQLVRQMAGVLRGDETLRAIVGLPLLYGVGGGVGLAFTAGRLSGLPLAVLLPYVTLMPYFSGHYGMISPVRFTSLLTPPLAGALAVAAVALWERSAALLGPPGRGRRLLGGTLALLLAAYPLGSLFAHYAAVEARGLSGRPLLELSREVVALEPEWPVYVSETPPMLDVHGIPYVPRAYALFAGAPQAFLPPDRIVGRLFETRGPAHIFMTAEDAAFVGGFAELTPWLSRANEEALSRGFGLYTVRPTAVLTVPAFVRTDVDAAPDVRSDLVFGGTLQLVGYEAPEAIRGGAWLEVALYWRAVGAVAPGQYVGFVHLYDPRTGELVAQDDHPLGGALYPAPAWQPDEVVMDHHALSVPEEVSALTYTLRAGVYTWPDLTRLDVPGRVDDVVTLTELSVGGETEGAGYD
jgi:hypothetical protein